jgi:hypothetical protein
MAILARYDFIFEKKSSSTIPFFSFSRELYELPVALAKENFELFISLIEFSAAPKFP